MAPHAMNTTLATLKPRADPGPSRLPMAAHQSLHADFHQNNLAFEQPLQAALSLRLTADWQLCPQHLAHLRNPTSAPPCPNGLACPFRHAQPANTNFDRASQQQQQPNQQHQYGRSGGAAVLGGGSALEPLRRTVCKHWLRGLCKKGDHCDYLHEYDLRRMPECRFYATFGFCNQGDECLYLHVDARAKIRECERYRRGFCEFGPACPKRHVRRAACPYYIAGFCPKGPDCKLGHPKATHPSLQSRATSPIMTHKPMTAEEAFGPSAFARERMERGELPPRRHFRDGGGGGGGGVGTGGGGAGAMAVGDGDGAAGAGGLTGRYGPYGPGGAKRMHGERGAGADEEQGGARRPRRDLSEVLCFKCGEYGHFANTCPNPNRPGNRGGLERMAGGRGGGGMGMGGGGGFRG